MKVLVVGNGGREHGIVWKLSQSKLIDQIFTAPGNPGTSDFGINVPIDILNIDGLLKFAVEEEIDITIVGPEEPLVEGIVDRFKEKGLRIFGPDKQAARLEGSKVFSKELMRKYNIPTAEYGVYEDIDEAITYIKAKGAPIVVKAEGLAAGKGVFVAEDIDAAINAVKTILSKNTFGNAGKKIVIEEFLDGEEATILAFIDGNNVIPMLSSQDHKQAYDNDQGPNTGGMGAYAPAPVVDETMMEKIYKDILLPTVEALKKEGINYKGILYCGLMIKDGKPKVLEYNVRFGDPEAQVILPLLKTDLLEIVEAVIDGRLGKLKIDWFDKKALCVVMASGGYPSSYKKGIKIDGIDDARVLENIMVFQAATKMKDGQLLTNGGRVLAVTAVGNDFKGVIEKAYTGIDQIYFYDFHIRHDIGGKISKYKTKWEALI